MSAKIVIAALVHPGSLVKPRSAHPRPPRSPEPSQRQSKVPPRPLDTDTVGPGPALVVAGDGRLRARLARRLRQLGWSVATSTHVSTSASAHWPLVVLASTEAGEELAEMLASLRARSNSASAWILSLTRETNDTAWSALLGAGADDTGTLDHAEMASRLAVADRHARARERQRQQLRRLELLGDSVAALPVGLTITDPSGVITLVNEAQSELTGAPSSTLLGRPARTLAPARLWQPSPAVNVAETGTWRRESVNVRAEGEEFPVELISAGIKAPDGELVAVVTACLDITERKRTERLLRESERLFAHAFEANPDPAVVSTLEDGRQLLVNDAYLRVYGGTREQIIGRSALAIGLWADSRDRERFVAELRRCGAVKDFEVRHDARLGQGRVSLLSAHLVEIQGETCVFSINREITEHKKIAAELSQGRARMASILRSLPVAVLTGDLGGRLTWVSDSIERLTGLPMSTFLGRRGAWLGRIAGVDRRSVLTAFLALARRPSTAFECRFRVVDGSYRWFRGTLGVADGAAAGANQVIGVVADVTGEKQAQQALAESERRYRLLFERNLAGVYRSSLDGRIEDCNEAFAHIYGYASRAEILAVPANSLYLHSDDRQRFVATLRSSGALISHESRGRRCDGSPLWLLENASLVPDDAGALTHLQGTVIDITARKESQIERDRLIRLVWALAAISAELLVAPKAEEAIRALIEVLGQAVEAQHVSWLELLKAPGGEWSAVLREEWGAPTVAGRSRSWQGRPFPLAGLERLIVALERGETVACTGSALPAKERAALARTRVKSLLAAPILVRGVLCGMILLDDGAHERAWHKDEADVLGSTAHMLAIALDRWEHEQRHERLASVIEQSAEAVLIGDRDGRVLYVNQALAELTGQPRESAVGGELRAVLGGLVAEDELELLVQALQKHCDWRGMLHGNRPDGNAVVLQTALSPILGQYGRPDGFSVIALNVTKQERLADQLRRAQRMEELGRLAAGIAHDFNNLIAVVLASSELLARRFAGTPGLAAEMATVNRSLAHARELTRSLLAFARRQVLAREHLDLATLVGGMLPMLRRLLPETIQVNFKTSEDAGVFADPGQLEQVVMNLCTNARDAMPTGGVLTLATTTLDLTPEYLTSHPWAHAGRYVKLTVADTGAGMDETTVTQIFEPFFTTKEPTHGTGLGLVTVLGIAKQHGGMIDVSSEVGKGSSFDVFLPHAAAPTPQAPTLFETEVQPCGHERLLVVEDQPDLRVITARVLHEAGYHVEAARNGAEALAILERDPSGFDLVVSDLVMPVLGGAELHRRATSLGVRTPFLFTSGYSEPLDDDLSKLPSVDFIAKPCSIDELVRKIRQLLAHSSTTKI
jgi:two-component system cell cycle sensor histidine kinase/response regulator CckA